MSAPVVVLGVGGWVICSRCAAKWAGPFDLDLAPAIAHAMNHDPSFPVPRHARPGQGLCCGTEIPPTFRAPAPAEVEPQEEYILIPLPGPDEARPGLADVGWGILALGVGTCRLLAFAAVAARAVASAPRLLFGGALVLGLGWYSGIGGAAVSWLADLVVTLGMVALVGAVATFAAVFVGKRFEGPEDSPVLVSTRPFEDHRDG